MKQSVCGLSLQELQKKIEEVQLPKFRAGQLMNWVYEKCAARWDEITNLSEADKTKIAGHLNLNPLEPAEEYALEGKESVKILFKTEDGYLLESVLISQSDRDTVCVSTQLGCKIGCTFCASGKGKFVRNLTAGEILAQILWIQKLIGKKITNVVYMGMGEPLDNFDETMKSLDLLTAAEGLHLGARRITVSTSGVVPEILEFVERADGRIRLSISLHATTDKLRSELVPVNKKYGIQELIETLSEVNQRLKRSITFEYTLISGVNDSDEEAARLAKISNRLLAKVNLIPYNPIREMDYRSPSEESIVRFRKTLERAGVRVTLRQTAGREIDAACGQLRLDRSS